MRLFDDLNGLNVLNALNKLDIDIATTAPG
jgi:hypothetical protein